MGKGTFEPFTNNIYLNIKGIRQYADKRDKESMVLAYAEWK